MMNQGMRQSVVRTMKNACVASCQKLASRMERARTNLMTELRATFGLPDKLFRLALGEAEALAWQTEYPHLLFPVLATEKVQAAAAWHTRQQSMARHRFVSRPAA